MIILLHGLVKYNALCDVKSLNIRSTSLLESSMLLNIQQPFSKLENTILIPASPEKVTRMQYNCIMLICFLPYIQAENFRVFRIKQTNETHCTFTDEDVS